MASPNSNVTYVDNNEPAVCADWLNDLGTFFYSLFQGSTTVTEARDALQIREFQWGQWAIKDQDNAVETGNNFVFPMTQDGTFLEVQGFVKTASSSGPVEIDVLKNGVSILSQTIIIDEGENNSIDSGTQPVISTATFARGDTITLEILDGGTGAVGPIVSASIVWDWTEV